MNGNSDKMMSEPIDSAASNEQDNKLDSNNVNDKNVANGTCNNSSDLEHHVKKNALDILDLNTSKCNQDVSGDKETKDDIAIPQNDTSVDDDMLSDMDKKHIGDDSPKEREPFNILSNSSIKSLNTLPLEHDVNNVNEKIMEDPKGKINRSNSSNIPKQVDNLNGLKSSCNSGAGPSDHYKDTLKITNCSEETELESLQSIENGLEEDKDKNESFKIVTIERHHSDGEKSPDYSNDDHFATTEDLLDNGVITKSDEVIILETDEMDNQNKALEIHEIGSDNSDNDDCVVTAVEKVLKKKVAGKKRKAPNITDVTPRRSSRTTKRVKYNDVVEQVDDGSDVEEVVLEDPLANMIQESSVNNKSKQSKRKSNLKKSPSIIINNLPAKTPQINKKSNDLSKHIGPLLKPRGTTVTPVTVKTTATQATQVNLAAPILPTLTDDMVVIETPSFIVPYLYEKASAVPFKEFVGKLGKEVEEAKAKEEKELMEKIREEKAKREKEKQERRDRGEIVIDSDEEMNTEEILKKIAEKAARKEKRRRQREDDDASWDGSSGDETDDDDDSEEEGQLTVKDKAEIIQEVKDVGVNIETTTKSESYFDLSLGKFFMDIGSSLVQEFVQTDLLNDENRKLRREKKAGQKTKERQVSIALLTKNLKLSQKTNELFKFEQKKCKLCTFKTESVLAMAHHLETPHMKNNQYRCNYCSFEVRSPHDILLHIEKEHSVKAKLERAPVPHQCTRCPFEDHSKAKMARHLVTCAKKFKPETNLAPPFEWEHPAKIVKISIGRNNATNFGRYHVDGASAPNGNVCIPIVPGNVPAFRMRAPLPSRAAPSAAILRQPVPQAAHPIANIRRQMIPPTPTGPTLTLPRQNSPMQPMNAGNTKGFVLCEICDGFIRNLEQLRNHMHRIHKVKIHSKMIYNRPPLNCQKCQFRFFTDQGLERHLLGSHGLVTRAIQEAANKGKDTGRCPVCGKVCYWKLLAHVSREHMLVLKPAHLSYKCTVCTATFGMYRQFESHVYSAHSVIAKKAIETKVGAATSKSEANDNAAKLLQTNNEITITPRSEKVNAPAK